MTAIAITLTEILVAGLPAAILLDPRASRSRILGLSFLLGSGIASLLLLFLSLLAVPWTRLNVTVVLLAVTVLLWMPMVRRRGITPRTETAAGGNRWLAAAIGGATVAFVVAHGLLATRTPVGEWDFWAIWGLKARVFFEHGGIDWAFLETPWYAFTHPDYPPLLPLQYALVAVNHGAWHDRYLGIVTTLFGASLVFVAWDLLRDELRDRVLVAIGLFGLAWTALPLWMGTAEVPFIAYATAALLLMRRGWMVPGSVLLGFAACTKNEGIALVVAVAIALVLSGRRKDVVALWPAVALPAPWLLVRWFHALPTDLASGPVSERIARNVVRLPALFRALIVEWPHPALWVAMAVAFIVCWKQWKRERFLLVALAVQLLFYVAAYLPSPHVIEWHVHTSWPRLLQHAAPSLAFLALTLTGRRLRESPDDRNGDGDQRDDDGDRNDDREDDRQHGDAGREQHGHLHDEYDRQHGQEDQLERQQDELEGELDR